MKDVMVPKGWRVATIMDVAASSGGGTPSKSDPSYWDDGTIPWVSPKDMKSFLVTSSEDSVTAKALDRLTLIPSESVLVVVRSGILSRTLPVSINKTPVTVNQDMRAFVPASGVDARYIAWQLVSKERDILDRCAKDGTTVASIEGPALASYPIAIAPLKEQTRIVEKLEELLSDLDAGVAELRAAQRKLAQYRQSLLKAAVEGALTADWRAARHRSEKLPRSSSRRKPGSSVFATYESESLDPGFHRDDGNSETGADLLQRILTERRTRWETRQLAKFAEQGKTPPKEWKAKYPEPVEPDITNLPALPGGWVWATIDQIAHVGTGVTPLRSKRTYFDGGDIPWTTSGALNDELVTSATEYVAQLAMDECRLEMYPTGSLLVAMYGEGKTRGKCAELAFSSTINQAIAAIVFEKSAITVRPHVKTVLLDAYEAMRKQASGGVQPNLNLQIVKALAVPLPSLPEQAEIAITLNAALAAVKDQQVAIEIALNQSAAQRKNILKAAFAGQLVPQDPNDEPASVLLERIRAERATGGASASKRGRKVKEAI